MKTTLSIEVKLDVAKALAALTGLVTAIAALLKIL